MYPKLLNQHFKTDAPSKVWVTDITYIWTREGWLYLASVMDLYKNMIFEESLGQVCKASGYIAGYLSQAIAACNGTYFKRGPES